MIFHFMDFRCSFVLDDIEDTFSTKLGYID